MIAGKKYNGLQVDIWSCGVILFALICGYLPFEDPNTAQLYKKILNADYSIPDHVSKEARMLIQGILNTDPNKRYTIEIIRKHPWYQLSIPREHKGIILGEHRIPIDYRIVEEAVSLGLNREALMKSIEGNRHNSETSTYYILLKKHIRNGEVSPANISSDGCNPIGIGRSIISMRETPKAANIIKLINKDISNFNRTIPKQPVEEQTKKFSLQMNDAHLLAFKKVLNKRQSPKNILNMTALGPVNINWVTNDKEVELPRRKKTTSMGCRTRKNAQCINIKQPCSNSKVYTIVSAYKNQKREASLPFKPQEPHANRPVGIFNRNRFVINSNMKDRNIQSIYSSYRNKSSKKETDKLNLTSAYDDELFTTKGACDLNKTMNLSSISKRRTKSRDMSAKRNNKQQ